jgi:hypothetical protein
MPTNQFDATPSLLGYIYQIRYGLLVSLKKMREVDDPDDYFVSIETIDDIAFDKDGTPEELLQTKYHSNPGNLSNKSPDIWKTIRVWVESYKRNQLDFINCSLFLITTEKIDGGSLAEFLSNSVHRNPIAAYEKMKVIAKDKPSQKNKEAFAAFNSLTEYEQKKFAECIYVMDNSENLAEIEKHLSMNLRGMVQESQLEPLLTRLEGKWFATVIKVLECQDGRINLGYLVETLNDLREQFLPSNLPDDYSSAEIKDLDIDQESRIFLNQLELIGAGKILLKKALLDFYRASEQRSRWIDDGLLKPGELKHYFKKLEEEWLLHFGLAEAKFGLSDDNSKKRLGLEVYSACQNDGAKPIRENFIEAYFARGTFHKLADQLVVGWHPDFEALLGDNSKPEVA